MGAREDLLEKNAEHGYYSIKRKYTQKELADFYAEKYYQQDHSQYRREYSPEDIEYFKLASREAEFICRNKISKDYNYKSYLDIGCGEGWMMSYFKERGYDVLGVDFSKEGMRAHNPELLSDLIEGDTLQTVLSLDSQYDIITMKNLLEHVIDPEGLVRDVKKIMSDDSVLMINVPNDFSRLHMELKDHDLIDKDFWVIPPEHLTYFSHESLNSLMESNGFDLCFQTTDFPIDMDLLVPELNYVLNKKMGKAAHKRRVAFELFVSRTSMESLVDFHHALGKSGLGRSVINYYKKRTEIL